MAISKSAQDRLELTQRLKFLADVTALRTLCSPMAIDRLASQVESLNTTEQRSFLRGYRLATATPLYSMLRFIVNAPWLLGLEYDETLFNWLNYRRPESGDTILDAVSDPTSDLGRVCNIFEDAMDALRKAEGGLETTIAAVEKCGRIATAFDSLISGPRIVYLASREEWLDREPILRSILSERVLDYAEYESSIVEFAHMIVWRDKEELRPIGDMAGSKAETHLGYISLFPFSNGVPVEWLGGFWFGIDLLIQFYGIELSSHFDSSHFAPRDWLKDLTSFVNMDVPQVEWPSTEYGLTEFSKFEIDRFLGHFEVNMMKSVSSKRRLAAILGVDQVQLMADSSSTALLELEAMLSGAITMSGDTKVRLLILTHSVDSDGDDRTWVSIALRFPIYSNIGSNFSKWYLFYKVYHEGFVDDTDVGRAIKATDKLLLKFTDNLDIEQITDIDSKDFLVHCTSPVFRAMRKFNHDAEQVNNRLRSGNSELLAAFWLVSQGYQLVKIAFKHASIGTYEYDAIGVKSGKCLVVEVKGGGTIDTKLRRQIGNLANKIEHLRDRLPILAATLGYDSSIDDISGLFISLADLDDFKSDYPSIRLWGYNQFVAQLKSIGLPEKMVGLLDRADIMLVKWASDSSNDSFSDGLEEYLQ